MKYGIASIILALVGICFVVWFNYQFSKDYIEFATKFNSENSPVPSVGMTNWLYKSIAIGVSLIVLTLGIKSYRIRNKIGIFGVILSLLLLILVFFPLWSYLAHYQCPRC